MWQYPQVPRTKVDDVDNEHFSNNIAVLVSLVQMSAPLSSAKNGIRMVLVG
jgi:hypothetical protein